VGARRVSLVVAAVCAAGCGTADAPSDPTCVAAPRECQPLYAPTFDALFERTLNPTCGVGGSTCHASGGAGTHGGVVFDNPDRAYQALVADRSWKIVDPGKPECSKIVYKIVSSDPYVTMPPGRPMSDAERCVIVSWIAAGAHR